MIIHKIADKLKVQYLIVSCKLQAIGKVKKLNKWVPHEVTDRYMMRGLEMCIRNKKEPLLHRMVTCNKKWILYDNLQCK